MGCTQSTNVSHPTSNDIDNNNNNNNTNNNSTYSTTSTTVKTIKLSSTQPTHIKVQSKDINNINIHNDSHSNNIDYAPMKPVRNEEKYQIMKTLGEGASCRVLSVRDRNTHDLYAMKCLSKTEKINYTLYNNEITILNKLGQHPHILQLVNNYESKTDYNIITQLYTGGELFDQVANGSFSEKIASNLAKQMLLAISYCHSNNICHRDIKPENFVFDTTVNNDNRDIIGNMRLIDFGCAKVVDNLSSIIHDVAGSPYYCAPEVLIDNYIRTVNIWQMSDIWSIGVIIYLLVTGYPPFNGDTQDIIFRKIRRGKYRFPSHTVLSDSVKDLINKMLKYNPNERISSIDALQHEWILGDNVSDQPLPDTLVTALNAFRTQCRLKKVVARVLCNRMTDDDKISLGNVFQQFDVNGDGTLGADEITAMMKHIGKNKTDAMQFMNDIDENGDGSVTIDEFTTAAVQGKLQSSNVDEMKATFDIFDIDGDGFVTHQEIEQICNFLTPNAVSDLINEVDKNNDGKINFNEWIKAMQDISDKVERTKTIVNNNSKLDSVKGNKNEVVNGLDSSSNHNNIITA